MVRDNLEKAEQELKDGFRIIHFDKFKDKEDVTIYINHPDIGLQAKIQEFYIKRYNEILRDSQSNVPTKKQMEKILNEKGIWTKEDEDKLESTRKRLSEIEIEALTERGKDNQNTAKLKSLENQYNKVRDSLLDQVGIKEGYLGKTIEGICDTDTNLYKAVICIKYADGTPVWKTLDELKRENRDPHVFDIIIEANYFWQGLNREILNALPEKIFSSGASAEENSKE